jgi:leucyl-tRNA synthetase
MQGYNVLYPIGYDSLGLPAENAAINAGTHPEEYTKKSIANFMRQQKAMGWSYDWSRMVKSSDPEFYKWDQWIFLQMLKKGLAYRKKASVNWCSKCNTVLANEQVVDGKCWRHEDTEVEIKHLEQWFLKITDYAEELINGLEKLDWPENAKKRQLNWIGKSYGYEIGFDIDGKKWPIFTTRPDTLFGVTFMVVSAQHPRLMELVTKEQKKEVEKFLKKIKSTSQKDIEELEKEGAFTGSYAINPATGGKVPVYAGNFVVADYGCGMVMAVPAHDQRDFEFAKKYKIPIEVVIKPFEYELNAGKMARAFTGEGELINSGEFNYSSSEEAIEKIGKKFGNKTVNYKLRDWLISRQRYWGTPIPVVYCEKCGVVPVPEKDLPVELPKKVKFGKGNPLATNENFVNVKCPECQGKARRETDTMDTFANSSWYYLRYTDPKNDKEIFDKKKANYWAPVDQYIGGPEHITMHLIYIRFYTKFLRDIGLLKFDEPALRYFTQGIVHGADGEKMSKSRGNIIEPLEMIGKFGADTLRLALVSFASPDRNSSWDEKIVFGSHKFLNRVYEYFDNFKTGKADERTEHKLNKTIKEVTDYVQNLKHNLAVIKIRELFEHFSDKEIDKKTAESFLKLLHVYCPFIAEELWEKLGNKEFISLAPWPSWDEKKINEDFEKTERAVEKTVGDILNILKIVKGEKIYVYVLPQELKNYSALEIGKRVGKEVFVFAVNDKNKYDPQGKAGKAKPGKPAIYVE